MTSWTPKLPPGSHPLYVAIADVLAADVAAGRLEPGAKLPTHRDLARRLEVNVGTVTRAYAEAARRGLLDGEVGRGSFVRRRDPAPGALFPPEGEPAEVDFAFNLPAGGASDEERRAALRRLLEESDLGPLFERYQIAGVPSQRAAGARWLASRGLEASAERTLVTSGAQQALALVFASLCEAGDVVLADQLTYAGMKVLAQMLRLRLVGLEIDAEGLVPEAFEQAARGGARALYTMPTIHNPTGAVMPLERRRSVARIAREHGVAIVEDDSYAFLQEDAPPALASLAPERTWHVESFSKILAAGIRVGLVLAPEGQAERLVSATHGIGWMAAPLMGELAARWIEDGTAARIAAEKRAEAQERQRLARRVLGEPATPSSLSSCHLWLPLPEPWRSDEFTARARQAGVAVAPPGAFLVGRAADPHAVRVCLGTPPSRAAAERGVRALAALLSSAPGPARSVV